MNVRPLAVVALLACTSEPEPEPDGVEATLPRVDITMAPGDRDAMVVQGRTILDAVGPDCLDAPAPNPYTWFPATVSVDGQVVDEVGVRKKGFIGSLSDERPSLKVKFDTYVPGQTLNGAERLTLNNNNQDPARLRSCLAYAYFAQVGVRAPSCDFVQVFLNDEDLGAYSEVSSIKKDFLRETFGDADGDLYEGTLSDFTEVWIGTFEAKTDDTAPPSEGLRDLVDALALPDEELRAGLEAVLDLDAYITYWVAETLVGHWDGYNGNNNNFFLYRDPADGLFHFIPWGPDNAWTDGWFGDAPLYAVATLPRRLYATDWGRDLFYAELRRQHETHARPSELRDAFDRMREEVLSVALDRDAVSSAIDDTWAVVEARYAAYARLLEGEPPELPNEPRPEPCLDILGELSVSFEGTWGGLDRNPFELGTASWDVALEDGEFPLQFYSGAIAGLDEDGRAILGAFGIGVEEQLEQLYISLEPEQVTPGTVEVDVVRTYGFLMRRGVDEPEEANELWGYVAGTLTLDEAGTSPGDVVRGRIEGAILRPEE